MEEGWRDTRIDGFDERNEPGVGKNQSKGWRVGGPSASQFRIEVIGMDYTTSIPPFRRNALAPPIAIALHTNATWARASGREVAFLHL